MVARPICGQHETASVATCNSQLLPTNQICELLSYPKKTKNPNPSPIGNRFGFFLFGGRGWIRTTEAEKQQIYSLSPLATREHAQILFTSVAGRLVYFIRLRAICQLLFSDFCSFSAEAVGRVSFGSDVSGARNPARRRWLRRTWGIGQ